MIRSKILRIWGHIIFPDKIILDLECGHFAVWDRAVEEFPWWLDFQDCVPLFEYMINHDHAMACGQCDGQM